MNTGGDRQTGRTYRLIERMVKDSFRDNIIVTYFIVSNRVMIDYSKELLIKYIEGIKDDGLSLTVKENSVKINQHMFVFTTYLNPAVILGMDMQPMLIGSRAKVYLDHVVEHSDIRDK